MGIPSIPSSSSYFNCTIYSISSCSVKGGKSFSQSEGIDSISWCYLFLCVRALLSGRPFTSSWWTTWLGVAATIFCGGLLSVLSFRMVVHVCLLHFVVMSVFSIIFCRLCCFSWLNNDENIPPKSNVVWPNGLLI